MNVLTKNMQEQLQYCFSLDEEEFKFEFDFMKFYITQEKPGYPYLPSEVNDTT